MSERPDSQCHGSAGTPPSVGESPFALGPPWADYYCPPRLGIIHLLAWTAATAMLLKLSMAVEMIRTETGDSLPPGQEVFLGAFRLVGTTAVAAAFVGAWILLWAKVRRLPGRLHPGHWLLLILAVASSLSLLSWALHSLAVATGLVDEYSAGRLGLLLYGLPEILSAALYFYAAVMSRHGRRWKVCFGTLAAVDLLRGLLSVAAFVLDEFWSLIYAPVWPLAVGGVLVVAVLRDRRRGPRRDWLHWLGVAVIATGTAQWLAWWAWVTYAVPWLESLSGR